MQQHATNAVVVHILPYAHARAGLLLYITALAKACKPRPANTIITHATTGTYELEGLQRTDDKYNVPSSAFKRLHALYLAHNLLFAVRNSTASSLPPPYKSANMSDIEQDLLALINRLVRLASCRGLALSDNVGSSIMKLLDYYLDQDGIDQTVVTSLRGLAERCDEREWEQALDEVDALADQKALDDQRAAAAASQWVLPKQHGVRDEPWYELPAANGLYMKRTRGYPLRAAAFPQGGYFINSGGTYIHNTNAIRAIANRINRSRSQPRAEEGGPRSSRRAPPRVRSACGQTSPRHRPPWQRRSPRPGAPHAQPLGLLA